MRFSTNPTAAAVGLVALAAACAGQALPPPAPQAILLAIGKGKAADPLQMQERAATAVRKVTDAARTFQPTVVVEAIVEDAMTREEFRRRRHKAKVTGDIVRERLKRLARTATAEDTVIVYTHTHGTQEEPGARRIPAGMLMNPAPRQRPDLAILAWDEYADLLLDIPAKNVVVLTMACFSGGLVERLDTPQFRKRWEGRRAEGRSFLVLTSQNGKSESPPIIRDGELINPFTYAVAKALAGEADGFALIDGKPATAAKDGRLTAGELVDFVLYTTEHTPSQAAARPNTAKPQCTGSFDRDTELLGGKPAEVR